MTSLQDIRRKRLAADLARLEKLRCSAIDWRAKGSPCDVIHLTYTIRSVVGRNALNQPKYSHIHEVEVTIPSKYPMEPPVARMAEESRVPFHPNFYASGLICTQNTLWTVDQSLAGFCLQIAKMLQFDPEVTDPNSAANWEARDWYISNLNKGLFPTDDQVLPTLGIDDDFTLESDFEILEIR